jgi:hypothetical protein
MRSTPLHFQEYRQDEKVVWRAGCMWLEGLEKKSGGAVRMLTSKRRLEPDRFTERSHYGGADGEGQAILRNEANCAAACGAFVK